MLLAVVAFHYSSFTVVFSSSTHLFENLVSRRPHHHFGGETNKKEEQKEGERLRYIRLSSSYSYYYIIAPGYYIKGE